jgi:hypothetical protein
VSEWEEQRGGVEVYLLQGEAWGRGRRGEHGVDAVGARRRAAVRLQEVNDGFAQRPLEFFFLSQIGPRLILLFSFKTSRI